MTGPGGRTWRALGRPLGTAGTLWVFDPDTADRNLTSLVRRRVVVTALVAAPVAAALAYALAAGATRPLVRLQRRTSGLDPRVRRERPRHDPTGVTEVDDLAATVATVLARYDEQAVRTEEALQTARSFASAAAHELRTPLMSMGTNLDVLALDTGTGARLAPRDRREAVEDLRSEHARLLALLTMLRELGRGDLVGSDAFAPTDLGDLCDAAVGDLRRREPDTVVTFVCAPCPPVHGWSPGLRTLIDNLLVNAVAHGAGPDGVAHIEVRLSPAGAPAGPVAVLTVDDHGPGIPDSEKPRVFDRFLRGPASSGSGLGLTLVAQQAALHGGTVRATDRPGGPGARFEVRLPLHRRAAPAPPRGWLARAAAEPQEGRGA